jgi:ABC-2 type transport system permease protein
LAQSVYHLYIKSQVWIPILLFLPAILSSTFLGLAVSALARSQTETLVAAAGYFFALALLTGFFYPIDQSPTAVQALSTLFPLTQLRPAMNSWMLGEGTVPHLWSTVGWAVVQSFAYSLVAVLAFRNMRKSM